MRLASYYLLAAISGASSVFSEVHSLPCYGLLITNNHQLRRRALPSSGGLVDDVIRHAGSNAGVRGLLDDVARTGKSAIESLFSHNGGGGKAAGSSTKSMGKAAKSVKQIIGESSRHPHVVNPTAVVHPASSASVTSPVSRRATSNVAVPFKHNTNGLQTAMRKPGTPKNKPKVAFIPKPDVQSFSPSVSQGASNAPLPSPKSVSSPHRVTPSSLVRQVSNAGTVHSVAHSTLTTAATSHTSVKPLAEHSKKEQWKYSLQDHPYLFYSTVTGGLMTANSAIAHHYVQKHENEVLDVKKQLGMAPIDISGEISEVKEMLKAKQKANKET